MTESSARTWVTASLLGGNLVTFLTVLILWLAGGFSSAEFKQLILVLTPLLFAYATPIARSILADLRAYQRTDPPINGTAFWILVLLPPLVQVLTIALCVLKAYNTGIQSFDDLMIALGSIQTVFGIFIGLVVSTLFGGALPDQTESKVQR